jgi:hypothetical protein
MSTSTLVLTPVLITPTPGVFTAMQGRRVPTGTPAAFMWPKACRLKPDQEQTLVAMGHLNPSALAAILDVDGYGATSSLHTCAQTVWQKLRGLSKDMWQARTDIGSWRWWVLRDGLVGMPYVVRDVFLPRHAWGDVPLPQGHTGVPILLMQAAPDTAHARLATTARLVEDFTIVCGRDFPYTAVSSPLWLP